MYKMQWQHISTRLNCTLNLISIQQGELESRASQEKYFRQILNDTIKSLRKNEKSYLFNEEQTTMIKKMALKEKIPCMVREIHEGIWLVMRK